MAGLVNYLCHIACKWIIGYISKMRFEAKGMQQSNRLADFLIMESRQRGELLTPLKLQKLMFYADAWHMVIHNSEITPEKFQAWIHGPVALSQYHRFKAYKWRPILDDIVKPSFGAETDGHLIEIVDVFGSETGTALEIMTYQETPWLAARGGIPDDQPCSEFIDKELTKEYYGKIYRQG